MTYRPFSSPYPSLCPETGPAIVSDPCHRHLRLSGPRPSGRRPRLRAARHAPPCRPVAFAFLVLVFLVFAGPALADVPAAWEPLGPEGGCVQSLHRLTDGHLLARACDGGRFLADAEVESWLPLGGGPPARGLPADPEPVWRATVDSVFRSDDLRATWTRVFHQEDDAFGILKDFRVLPGEAGPVLYWLRFLRDSGDFLQRSTDGGRSWETIGTGWPSTRSTALEALPSEPSVLYLVAGIDQPVYRSEDGGETFVHAGRGLLGAREGQALAIAPSRSSRLYLVLRGGGVFVSDDRGGRWVATGAKLTASRLTLRVDPLDPDRLEARADGARWLSEDGARTFRPADPEDAVVRDLLVVNNGTMVAAVGSGGTEGGSRSPLGGIVVSADGGRTWEARNEGLWAAGVEDVALVPAETPHLLAAAAGRVLSKRGDGPWSTLPPLPGPGRARRLFPDPYDAEHWLVSTRHAVAETRDGGASWKSFGVPCVDVLSVAFVPGPGEQLFLSGGFNLGGCGLPPAACGLWERPAPRQSLVCRRGDTLSAAGELEGPNNAIPVVASPAQAGLLFAVDHGAFASRDGAVSWDELSLSAGNRTLVSEGPAALAVHPFDPDVLWVGLRNGEVWGSTDGGVEWTLVSPPAGWPAEPLLEGDGPTLPATRVTSLVVDPVDPGHLYALAGGRIWVLDSAASGEWVLLSEGLDAITDLELDPADPATVYAVVGQQGVWRLDRRLPRAPCVSDERTLCLGEGGRFRVQAAWQDFDDWSGVGRGAERTAQTGTFRFFDGDNTELVVKVLDGREVNDRWWVFYASLSNVPYTLVVTDTETGESIGYYNPERHFASRGDVAAFPEGRAGAAPDRAPAAPPERSFVAPEPCVPSATVLCLADGRFQVEATWRDFAGDTGAGRAIPDEAEGGDFADGADTGYLWFFAPGNYELAVKILDGRPLNGHWWLFYGSLSNVAYTLRVTDTATGEVLESTNPERSFGSRGDVRAFAD